MSSIKLSPNASGTGEFTIAAPNSNTNRTLTLPDASGTLLTNSGTEAGAFSTLSVAGNNISAVNSLGFRNRIINGDMRIDQRNAGASVTGGSGGYSVDRWNSAFAQSGKFNYGQSSVAPSGFTNSLLHTVASAYTSAAGDYFLLQHYIEGLNVADLGFGTASASSVTISFWVRSSITGTYSVAVTNGSDNRAYVTTFTVNSANTFEYKSVTIPGDVAGTWATNNTKGLSLKFDLGSGSTYVAASTNTWVSTNTFKASGSVSLVANSGATFYITGVQLEAGSVATPFERRDYGRELMMCQRYYELGPTTVPVWLQSTTTGKFCAQYQVQKRATASISTVSGTYLGQYQANTFASGFNWSLGTMTFTLFAGADNTGGFAVDFSFPSAFPGGTGYIFIWNNLRQPFWAASAEL